MWSERLRSHPPRPGSEPEWEDLLLRIEVVPRVVRFTLEAPPSAAAPAVLGEMIGREAAVGRWLEALATPGGPAGPASPAPEARGDVQVLAHQFASLRARTFAMVQRRGLEVWRWEAEFEGGPAVSVHQVLSALAEADGAALASLRAGPRC